MTLRGLLRMAAGVALALFVVANWSTPSEAHTGHGAPGQRTHQAVSVPAAKAVAVVPVVERAISTATQDCGGHMGKPGSGQSTCCSNTCHAVMSSDLMELRAVEVSLTVLPEPQSPAEVTGPMMHIKRPPETVRRAGRLTSSLA